jgi:hypothetical protein
VIIEIDAWHVIMSTSKGFDRFPTLGDLLRHFGADDAHWAAARRLLEQVVGRAESFLASATPGLLAWGKFIDSLSQEPEAPGHEKLILEQPGTNLLTAKLMTRGVRQLGKVLADEINQGRQVRAIADEIAKTKACSPLVISRRARRLRELCDLDGAKVAIPTAAQKAGLSVDLTEFNQLLQSACARDETACRELGQTVARLAPHLPEKSGRPISVETCTHLMFQLYLEHVGLRSSYTYSEIEDGDYVDPVTHATRLAVNKPRFSPRYANRLRKNKARVPSIRSSGSGN